MLALASGVLAGCAGTRGGESEPGSVDGALGQIELRLSASFVEISRVSVESDGATSFEISRQADGSYNGTFLLAPGIHSLIARGYAEDIVVAQSQAITVEIQAGTVTRTMMRLLDVTPEAPPLYGPILDGVAYPPSIVAGATASLSMVAIAPAGDPLEYTWSSDCEDSSFSTQAATTTWTKPTVGSCMITATVTSNQMASSEHFMIAVRAPGVEDGAAQIDAHVIRRPRLQFAFLDAGCFVDTNGANGVSCSTRPAAPDRMRYGFAVFDWGGSSPGVIELVDDCNGDSATTTQTLDYSYGRWTPPAAGGLCHVTATATSVDGLTSHATIAVFAHPGTASQEPAPYIAAALLPSWGYCVLSSPATDCGVGFVGANVYLYAQVIPDAAIYIEDDCVGRRPWIGSPNLMSVPDWTVPNLPGATCTVTVRATSLSGASKTVSARYSIVVP